MIEPTVVSMLAAVCATSAFGVVALRADPAIRFAVPAVSRRARGSDGLRLLAAIGSSRVGRLVPAPADGSGTGSRRTAEELRGIKLASAAGAGLVALFVGWPGALVAPVLVVAALRLPDLVTRIGQRRRLRETQGEVPLLLDVVASASSAGLTAQSALRRATSAVEGPLAEELRSMLHAVDLGARWRDELKRTTERLGVPELSRLAVTIGRAEALGSPLSEALARLAEQVREARRARAGERARTAPVKMLFPLVFLVLPAFLLLTVVPVLLATVRSLV